MVAANQHVSQLPESLRKAVFGNAGTLVVFRVGAHDSEDLAAELGLNNVRALTQTNNFHAWVRLMRDGAPLEPRAVQTNSPPLNGARLRKVIAHARARHMMSRGLVESRIVELYSRSSSNRRTKGKKRDADN